jgi:ribosome biogenesis GTPase / thiamine phosphate phosphatase
MLTGQIVRAQSGFYTVETDKGAITCRLRGLLKRGPRRGDVAAVGDWVSITPLGDATGVIEQVNLRSRLLSRLAPNPQGAYHQIIIANPDQAVFVFSCAQPAPRYGMLDRFLVIAEKQNIPAIIVANKIDLVGLAVARQSFGHYEPLGYPVFYTSACSGEGIDRLRGQLASKLSVFAGPSGVGKSSLLNWLLPGLDLDVREVSRATRKGKHTTVVREMFHLPGGGYIADTPGLKALALWDIAPEELDGYFPELRQRVAQCLFNDCTHIHEPGCAVRLAVELGEVHAQRYNSYVKMRLGEEEQL